MADVQTQIDYPRGLDFEQVWAALMENREQQKETDRLLKQNFKAQEETDRLLKNSIKDFNKRFGYLDNRFGDLVECIVSPKILNKFKDLGLEFETAASNFKVRDHKNEIYLEIDVFLQNTAVAMLVEIKTELKIKYINEHIARLEKMRKYADLHNESELKARHVFLGAVAGIVVSSDVKRYALENGLYLIEPSGEDLNITPPDSKHKEW